jgi:hypothetical protein
VRGAILILKPMRFEVAAMALTSLAMTALALLAVLQIGSAADPRACLRLEDLGQMPEGSVCVGLLDSFLRLTSRGQQVLGLMTPLPFVIGVILGVPIAGREIESGTAPLAWTLAESRTRWLMARLIRVAPVVIMLLIPPALAAELLEARIQPLIDPASSFIDWGSRGLPLLGYGLAAFGIGVTAGMLTGRTLPALIVAAVLCLLLQNGAHPALRRVLAPLAVPGAPAGALTARADLVMRVEAFDADGQLIDDVQGWLATHRLDLQAGRGPRVVLYVIPGADYPRVTLIEGALLSLGAATAVGASLLIINRRPPY